MKHWINRNYRTLIITAFLIPIITVAIVSISHVTKWYGISNPLTWATYLSIGIEIAALSALAAISANMGKKVYFPFFVVTLIQFIGNIFFAYTYIDINSKGFKDWVDLVSPLLQFMGVDANDYIGHRRFLSFFAGGMLPIISLSFLHMLVKFTEEDRKKDEKHDYIQEEFDEYKKEHSGQTISNEVPIVDAKDLMGEISKVRLSDEDIKKLEDILLKKSDNDNQLTKEKVITPALSDEEVRDMFMDEWEKRYEYVEDEEDKLLDEELNNLVYESQEPVFEENAVEPTIEDIEENNAKLEEENLKNSELVENIIQNEVDNGKDLVTNEETPSIVENIPTSEEEKKNQ